MTTAAVNYAEVLYELSVPQSSVEEAKELMRKAPEFLEALKNPLISFKEKERVIDRLLPEEVRNFVKTVCRHHKAGILKEILDEYEELCRKQQRILTAVLRYVTPPKEEQLENIRGFLCREFHAQKADIRLIEDKSLIGGFILQAGGMEYDWSLRGRYRKLEQKLTRR